MQGIRVTCPYTVFNSGVNRQKSRTCTSVESHPTSSSTVPNVAVSFTISSPTFKPYIIWQDTRHKNFKENIFRDPQCKNYLPPNGYIFTLFRPNYLPPNPMTLPQIVNELKQVAAHPPTKNSIVETFLKICSRPLQLRSQKSRSQQPRSEFPQFSMLPLELRSKIWHLALPAPRPLQINIRVGDRVRRFVIWGIGPSAIFEVCTESREEALSVYERKLWFSGPRDQPIFCSYRILNPTECVSIYTKKSSPPPLELALKSGEAVHSVVDWTNISLGFKVMLQSPNVFLEYFENWPPRENDVPCVLSMRHPPTESSKAAFERAWMKVRTSLPDRLKHKDVDWLVQGAETGVYVPQPDNQWSIGCGHYN
jgi:hypothetical protein